MNYDRIIVELFDRIQALEERVNTLEKQGLHAEITMPTASAESLTDRISAKYRGLTEYLLESNARRVCLTYPELEHILGFPLPDTAKKHMNAFWANTKTHSYASSWLEIGYRTRVDATNFIVTFEKNL